MSQLARVTEILGEHTGGYLTGPLATAILVVAGMQDEILDRLDELEQAVFAPPAPGDLLVVSPSGPQSLPAQPDLSQPRPPTRPAQGDLT